MGYHPARIRVLIKKLLKVKKIIMKKSKNEQVQKFLDEIMMFVPEKFEILKNLRQIVFSNYPEVKERIIYGGIMFSLEDDFGGLFVRKNHISFEFSFGVDMDDPDKILEGTGKYRRHLKIRSLADIKDKQVDFFVKQSA